MIQINHIQKILDAYTVRDILLATTTTHHIYSLTIFLPAEFLVHNVHLKKSHFIRFQAQLYPTNQLPGSTAYGRLALPPGFFLPRKMGEDKLFHHTGLESLDGGRY